MRPHTPSEEEKLDLWFLFVDIHVRPIDNLKVWTQGWTIYLHIFLNRRVTHWGYYSYQGWGLFQFRSSLQLQKCYKVDGYISRPARSHMPIIPHRASLRIGKLATFQLLHNTESPTYYYNFADRLTIVTYPPEWRTRRCSHTGTTLYTRF